MSTRSRSRSARSRASSRGWPAPGLLLLRAVGIARAAVSIRDEVPEPLGDLALREHRPIRQGTFRTEHSHLVLIRANGVERATNHVSHDQVEALVAELANGV